MPTVDDVPARGWIEPLSVLRVMQWAHFVVLPFAPLGRADLGSVRGLGGVACAVLGAAAALGYAYAINAIGDRASDASREKNPLVGVARVPRDVRFVTVGAAVLAIAAVVPLGAFSVACIATSVVASTVYSVGVRAKAVPVLGLIANTMIFLPLLFPCTPGSHPEFAALTAAFTGLLIQNQLVHELADVDEDTRGGDRTTARALGVGGTRIVCIAVALVTGIACLGTSDDLATRGIAALTLGLGAVVVIGTAEARLARRLHRHLSALGGAAMYLVGFMR